MRCVDQLSLSEQEQRSSSPSITQGEEALLSSSLLDDEDTTMSEMVK